MTDRDNGLDQHGEPSPDSVDHPQIAVADVESAGRSCVVIIAMAIVILVLLGIWVVYTTA